MVQPANIHLVENKHGGTSPPRIENMIKATVLGEEQYVPGEASRLTKDSHLPVNILICFVATARFWELYSISVRLWSVR